MVKIKDKQPMSEKSPSFSIPKQLEKRYGSALPSCKILFENFWITIAEEYFIRTSECFI